MLFGTQFVEADNVTFDHFRQQAVAVVVCDRIGPTLFIDRHEARLDQHRAVGTKTMSLIQIPGCKIDCNRVKHGRHHLAGHRALPDQRVQPILIFIEYIFQRFGRVCHRRWPDRFVCFLSILRLGFERARRLGHVFGAVSFRDQFANLGDGYLGKRYGIRAHVGNKADIAFARKLDTLVELLCDPHSPLRIETEFARRFLLQC